MFSRNFYRWVMGELSRKLFIGIDVLSSWLGGLKCI